MLDLAALPGDQDCRVTDMVGTNGPVLYFYSSDGCSRSDTILHDKLIGLLDAVQNGLTEYGQFSAFFNNAMAYLANCRR